MNNKGIILASIILSIGIVISSVIFIQALPADDGSETLLSFSFNSGKSNPTNQLVTFISLIIAALAVFFAPVVNMYVAKFNNKSSSRLSHKQLLSPMRQNWINNLRDLLAEMSSSLQHYYVAGFEDLENDEYRRLTLLEHKIRLMLNPNEQVNKELLTCINNLVGILQTQANPNNFHVEYDKLGSLSSTILKEEWNRVKSIDSF